MGFKCGIVGLPNVGKSTLFNALTKTAAAQAANYPFCTIEPNVGEVAMPEPRLNALAKIAGSKEIIPTRMNFVDIAGLVRGASKGEGLGNQFLANIRECDAIAYVLRCFENDDITHVEGKIDPIADLETVETELMLADLESLDKRVSNLEKRAKGGDKEAKLTLELVLRAKALLEDGKPARLTKRAAEEEKAFGMLQLLTALPVLYVCNVNEEDAAKGNAHTARVEERAKAEHAACVVICAQLEAEIAALSDEEQTEFLATVGLKSPASRAHPRRLRPAWPANLFHGWPEGSARLDDPEGLDCPASRGRHPWRFREGLHSRRDHWLRGFRQVQRRSRRQGSRQDAP
jgi:GTP-binding protein YchF